MSLTVTHIFITLQNLKAKYTTIVTTQVLGPMLGHVILQNVFFFSTTCEQWSKRLQVDLLRLDWALVVHHLSLGS